MPESSRAALSLWKQVRRQEFILPELTGTLPPSATAGTDPARAPGADLMGNSENSTFQGPFIADEREQGAAWPGETFAHPQQGPQTVQKGLGAVALPGPPQRQSCSHAPPPTDRHDLTHIVSWGLWGPTGLSLSLAWHWPQLGQASFPSDPRPRAGKEMKVGGAQKR